MRLCYLVGYPVGHSLSATMQNAVFRELGLGLRYDAHPVKPENLGTFVASILRASAVKGANVTIPHKVSVVKYLDEMDAVSSRIGAVNTIVNEGGRLKGYNTDGLGAARALEEAFGDLHGVKAVILGAGGSARAISYHLSTVVGEIVVLNRTLGNAQELVRNIAVYPECRAKVSPGPLTKGCLEEALDDADMVVNATPIGMSPSVGETPIERGLIKPEHLVFDIIYNPPRTRLLEEAEAAGARTLNGVGMLVYQGAESFRLWTGMDPPEGVMMRAVERALGVVRG